MMIAFRGPLAALAGLGAFASAAQAETAPDPSGPAVGVELFASTDSDDTDVVKLLGRASFLDKGPDHYAGIAVERAWFKPVGEQVRKDERIYADLAGGLGKGWLWKARLGTDGRSALGSVNIRAKDWSKEVFLEREIVETPRGVDKGIYYTFVGGSHDFAVSSIDTLTATAALQSFTGENRRFHLRGSFVHVLKPRLGLSLQLRARYFHSTEPGEFDYYSPRNFVQLLPVVQMRRFTGSGWMLLGAAGFGAQKATSSGWTTARLAELRVESPRGERGFRAFGQIQYSNNSLSGSGDYHYVMTRVGLTKAF